MKNKYLMPRHVNVQFVKDNLDEYLEDSLHLSRYTTNDPFYSKAKQNFINAYQFILERKDVANDYSCLITLHKILMDGLNDDINSTLTDKQIEELSQLINTPAKANLEIAIDVMLYILEKRLFKDGDVRAALMFANKILIDNGCGFITIGKDQDEQYRNLLHDFKEGRNNEIKEWVYKNCVKGKKMDSYQ